MPGPKKTLKRKSPSAVDIARAVKAQLPGWRIMTPDMPTHDAVRGAIKSVASGASIEDLKKRYLGGSSAVDVKSPKVVIERFSSSRRGSKSLRVQPKQGGPAKTADFVGGKIEIVQG
jgi:hypothetical protein